ncbi:TetR family transcriptional regulator [Streptomyces sp. SID8356]|uniref:TetR/AcrR family transcriptional regulator n=1 Tax=unclassified Streptomyces TaxID=2593676 RepID=UPI000475D991|nr:TetR/AcrR family transcriptional regulator [Streptomyces sp. CcalMP-8W]MYT37417.1 TetR family transcriptional regulator [Streptomyces sp. SID8356]
MSDIAGESGTRNRTRRAILGAAAEALARDRTATLADIARAAQVGRSTLHRYFPDRDVLVHAAVADSYLVIQQSIQDAAVDQGTALEAMRRLVAAIVDTGGRMLFLYGDSRVLEDFAARDGGSDAGEPGEGGESDTAPDSVSSMVVDLIRRGQSEGVFDPGLDVDWVQDVIWALVYTGCEAASRGTLPRHGVTTAVVRMLENGIREQ